MQSVEGNTAFITGGASGIGLGMARVFAAAGMNVAIGDLETAALDTASRELADGGAAPLTVALDVTDRDAMAAAADAIEAKFGKIHIVCNNAGVTHPVRMDQSTYNDWDWIVGVNLGGVINGVQTFLPRIKAHGEGGHIVNTASIAGLYAQEGTGIYATTKYGVVGLSESLRDEMVPYGIGVSVLCPGLVTSRLVEANRNRPKQYRDGGRGAAPGNSAQLNRYMQAGADPAEIGAAVLAAIKANKLYVLPHSEFRDALADRFQSILAAFGDGAPDPLRAEVTAERSRQLALMRSQRPD